MKCLFITQEYAPYFSEGGLGLSSNALPTVLQERHGFAHDVVLPYYPRLVEGLGLRTERVVDLPERELAGVQASPSVYRLRDHGGACEIYLLRADAWYDRPGIYRDGVYAPFSDEVERAAFFGTCVADWLEHQGVDYRLVHGNDWQSGAAMAHIRHRFPELPQLLTVHNGAYRGELTSDAAGVGLAPAQVSTPGDGPQDQPSLLLAAALAADAVLTCSPTYAEEMLGELGGSQLGAVLARRGLSGAVFGVNEELWDPTAIGRCTAPFEVDSVDVGKRLNKQALQKQVALREDDSLPVIGVCSRLVHEKGSDLLLDAVAGRVLSRELQLVLVGPAEGELRHRIRALCARAPEHLAYVPCFDQDVAWLTYAGADFTVMPSRVEPCGLNQLIAFRYGTLPLVSPVGGLRDTVVDLRQAPDWGSGFVIPEHTAQAVEETVRSALEWMSNRRDEVSATRRRVMRQDWSWSRTTRHYARVYGRLLGVDA